MLTQPREDTRIAVIGLPGQGKSVWRERFTGTIFRCTLWDPMHDKSLGPIVNVDEYGKNINNMRRGALHITVEPTTYDNETMQEEFNALCAYVEEIGAQHFAIEEIALIASPTSVPGNLNKLYIRGRHRFISLSAYGQRFHQFPIIVRGTSSEIIAFRQTDPDDIADFERRIKPDRSPVRLNELKDFHYIRWTPNDGAVLNKPLPLLPNKQEQLTNGARSSGTSIGINGSRDYGNSLPHSGDKEANRAYDALKLVP